MDGNEAYDMFKLIIEKIKRKSQKKKRKSEPAGLVESQSSESKDVTNESEYSEADEEAIRVQLWRDAQAGFKIIQGL